MKVKIDQEKCLGCGICETICPEGIEMINGKAVIINNDAKCFMKASEVCPVKIIKIN